MAQLVELIPQLLKLGCDDRHHWTFRQRRVPEENNTDQHDRKVPEPKNTGANHDVQDLKDPSESMPDVSIDPFPFEIWGSTIW
jgi:hypothetical protein